VNDAVLPDDIAAPPSFGEATRVWARIGFLSFGGPAGQIALMHKLLVEERRWISEERFLHALSYCMLLPGPEAQQLATYVGWTLHGTRGGLVAGGLFVAPGFIVMLALSAAYALYQEAAWFPALFFGLKAAVLAIVIEAVVRVGRRALTGRLHYAIAALAFLSLFMLDVPFPLVIAVAACVGFVAERYGSARAPDGPATPAAAGWRPPLWRTLGVAAFWIVVWQAPLVLIHALTSSSDVVAEAMTGEANAFGAIFSFFSRMAVVTFGGAYAVLAYVAQTAVSHYAWLRPGEMLDGLGLAETTPGPLVLVLCFVGFLAGFRNPLGLTPLAGGLVGASLTAWATFVPSFLWIFVGAPYIERLRDNKALAAAMAAVTAAVVGVILNLAVWFALHVLFADVGRLALITRRVTIAGGDFATVPLVSVAWPVWSTLDVSALLLAILSAVLLLRLKAGMMTVLAVSAGAGWLLSLG